MKLTKLDKVVSFILAASIVLNTIMYRTIQDNTILNIHIDPIDEYNNPIDQYIYIESPNYITKYQYNGETGEYIEVDKQNK